jgi:hypothetical protein
MTEEKLLVEISWWNTNLLSVYQMNIYILSRTIETQANYKPNNFKYLRG